MDQSRRRGVKVDPTTGMVAADWYKQYPTEWLSRNAIWVLTKMGRPTERRERLAVCLSRGSWKSVVRQLRERGLATGTIHEWELTAKGKEWARRFHEAAKKWGAP